MSPPVGAVALGWRRKDRVAGLGERVGIPVVG